MVRWQHAGNWLLDNMEILPGIPTIPLGSSALLVGLPETISRRRATKPLFSSSTGMNKFKRNIYNSKAHNLMAEGGKFRVNYAIHPHLMPKDQWLALVDELKKA